MSPARLGRFILDKAAVRLFIRVPSPDICGDEDFRDFINLDLPL